MAISPEEEQDAADLREAVGRVKIACYDHLRHVERYDARDLETSGYRGKTNAEAMQMIFQKYQKDIDKLKKEFLKKWPDD